MMINMKIKKVIVIVLEQQKEKIQVYYYIINRQIKKINVERKMMIIKLINFEKKKIFLKIRNNQAFCQTFSLKILFFEFNNYKELKCQKKIKKSKIIINLNI